MICYICKKKIVTQVRLYNLFKIETHHICDRCLMLYPIDINYQVIPNQSHVIEWYSMISEETVLDPMAYMSFIKPFYIDFLPIKSQAILLYLDVISDKLINILTSLEWHIYLVTLYDEIK